MSAKDFCIHNIVPLVSIPVLFLTGFSCGGIPILCKLTKTNKNIFGVMNAFSGGIFIGAALLHMLPDADDGFSNIAHIPDYPWANLIAAIGFSATLFLELVLSPGHEANILLNPNDPPSNDKNATRNQSNPIYIPRVNSPMILPLKANKNSPFFKFNQFSINGPEPAKAEKIIDPPNKISQQNSLTSSLLFIDQSPSLLRIPSDHHSNPNGRITNSNFLLRLPSSDPMTMSTHDGNSSNPIQVVYSNNTTPRKLPRRKSFSDTTPSNSNMDLVNDVSPRCPRRRSLDEPIETFRVRYFSRLFESGFNTAITLIKANNAHISNLPQLVHDHHAHGNDFFDNLMTADLGIKDIEIKDPSTIAAIVFLVVLSVHSVITGMAVGGNNSDRLEQWYLLLALIIHKGCASMALGISIKKSSFSMKFSLYLMAGFATSTPIGVAAGLALTESLHGQTHDILIASLTAFGGGTFLYLALFENLTEEFIESHKHLIPKWFAVIGGIATMAILALFS